VRCPRTRRSTGAPEPGAANPADARLFAVRALGHAGEDAAPELLRVLTSPSLFNAAERAEAARWLKRLGAAGQRALAQALPTLAPSPDPVPLTSLVGDDLGVLLAVLDALEAPGGARKSLNDLASLPPPPGAPASILRRISWIRCGAAKILAEDDFRDKRLMACDVMAKPAPVAEADAGAPAKPDAPLPASIGARALVEVLGRAEITGPRLSAYRVVLKSGDVRAREAAIELLDAHDEIEGSAAILADALGAKESGVVGTAAEVISKQPLRAGAEATPPRKGKRKKKKDKEKEAPPADEAKSVEPFAPAPALVKALIAALARPETGDDPELASTLLDAAGALALKDAKARVEELCRSSYPTTREHAQKALGLLGSEKKTCEPPADMTRGVVPKVATLPPPGLKRNRSHIEAAA
jgi:hypothetical protein